MTIKTTRDFLRNVKPGQLWHWLPQHQIDFIFGDPYAVGQQLYVRTDNPIPVEDRNVVVTIVEIVENSNGASGSTSNPDA